MKKRFLCAMLSLFLIVSFLPATALADEEIEEGFIASLDIERTDTSITVTVNDSTVLRDKKPTLSIPCDFTYAQVTFEGRVLASTLADGSISFRVAAGGTYTITKLSEPAPPSVPSHPTGSGSTGGKENTQEPEQDTALYPDVRQGEWYYEAVRYVTEKGLMAGTGKGFEPNTNTSRAMIWTILARLSGETVNGTGSNWYADAQAWAVKSGVSDGTDPNGSITREQLAAMLYRYAQANGLDVSVGEDTNILSYADATSVSEYAVSAMQWACGAGIINGMDGKLAPQGYATRAQVATMLMRYTALL